MLYRVEYTPRAVRQLKKMDPHTRKLVFAWIDKNLQHCEDPRQHGKALAANRSGQWRYRIGDYRVLANIQDDKILILILEIGHRRSIYDA